MRPSTLAHRLTLAGVLALVASLLIWYGGLFPSPKFGWWLPLLLITPLAPAIPGLIRRSSYTHAWASLLSLGYFIWSVTEVLTNPVERAPASAAVIASLLLFTGCVCFARFSARERQAGLTV